LLQEKQFLNAVLDSVEAGVVACDAEGAFTLFNRAARALHGLPDEPAPSERWIAHFELFQPDGVTPLPLEDSPLFQALRGERPRNVEMVIKPRQGAPRTVVASAQPIEPADGNTAGAVMAVHDITDRKRLEAQFRQSQKMDAIGRLAGGVAHDFNNILTVILGCSQIIDAKLGPEAEVREDLGEIERAAERAAALTHQLLAFSRLQILDLKVLDLNAVVTDIEQMLRRLIGPDVDLRTSIAASDATIRADAGQIQQVILNLALNARDAMPRGGQLTIGTREMRLDEEQVRHDPDLAAGRYVLLEVTDTGVGMDEETRSRIFEPFFSTKEPGKGTGLGLATVHGIVKQSGGHVEVWSEPGRGAAFRIYLPRVEAQARAPEPGARGGPAAALRGSEVVLVVEDEDPVRSFLLRTLQGGGYRVLEARDGVEALATCAAQDTPIDLVITDVLMPRMRGTELAARLAALNPRPKVLLISGYPDPSMFQDAEPAESRVLQKPFGPETLLLEVRRVLEGNVQAA
jgi:PAS domain S-box-containing protein